MWSGPLADAAPQSVAGFGEKSVLSTHVYCGQRACVPVQCVGSMRARTSTVRVHVEAVAGGRDVGNGLRFPRPVCLGLRRFS